MRLHRIRTQDEYVELTTKYKYDLVIIFFRAYWNTPCKVLTPRIEEILTEIPKGLMWEIDVDEIPWAGRKFNVVSLPCFLFLRNRMEVDRLTAMDTFCLPHKVILPRVIEKAQYWVRSDVPIPRYVPDPEPRLPSNIWQIHGEFYGEDQPYDRERELMGEYYEQRVGEETSERTGKREGRRSTKRKGRRSTKKSRSGSGSTKSGDRKRGGSQNRKESKSARRSGGEGRKRESKGKRRTVVFDGPAPRTASQASQVDRKGSGEARRRREAEQKKGGVHGPKRTTSKRINPIEQGGE